MVDMKAADPVEGTLIGQIIAGNEAAMKMYRRAHGPRQPNRRHRHTLASILRKAGRQSLCGIPHWTYLHAMSLMFDGYHCTPWLTAFAHATSFEAWGPKIWNRSRCRGPRGRNA
jgi:hypothetical protein